MSGLSCYSSDRTFCPISTAMSSSAQEGVARANGTDFEEIKAYKLGKKRWSYNQVQIMLTEKGGKRELYSKQALHCGAACEDLGDVGGIKYQVTLSNNEVVMMHVYLVYDYYQIDKSMEPQPNKSGAYDWILVNRSDCKRCCEGPTLRAIQRFGKLGRRTGSNCNTPRSCPSTGPRSLSRSNSSMKDSRYLYLSLDEAVTHVGCRNFRLVCGAYDASSSLIGTAVSPPIKVLANNDVPTGAAHIEIMMQVDSSWSGWESSFQPVQLEFPPISPAGRDIVRDGSSDSLITPKRLSARLRKAMSSGQKRLSYMLDDMEDDNPVMLRRTQSLKKGKIDDITKRTINLTARSGSADLTSPFTNLHVEDKNLERKSLGDPRSLVAWLEELNDDLRSADNQMSQGFVQQQHGLTQMYDNRFMGNTLPMTHAPDTNKIDDPISAFVQLMMSQSPPKEHVPIVEIPKPARQSPFNQDATGSLATPDSEYIDSLLGGINTTFDSFIQDEDVYPMYKVNQSRAPGEPFL